MITTKSHDEFTGFLNSLLRFYSQVHGIGKVFGNSYQMKLEIGGTIRGREPDVIYVAKRNFQRITERFLDGPADVAVEVVSVDSEERDRIEKFREYEAAGVREYWLIDPRKPSAEFFKLSVQGRFEPINIDEKGTFRSEAVEGFWLKTEWLLNDEPPELADAFVALGLINK
jgi:Uma2 family endonuclease